MNIGPLSIGADSPCRFIAELSNNANGKFENAIRLLDAAKAAGADAAKLQCYSVEELIALRGDGPAPEPWGSQGFTMATLYQRAMTPRDWFPKLFQHARDIELPLFSSVFGLESLLLLERCACPAYKIARLDNAHSDLIQAVTSRNKPVLVSTSEYDHRQWMGVGGGVYFLYCAPGYPTPNEHVALPMFDPRRTPYLGLSSHCLDPLLPIAAVARGCKLVEMHFMLDDEPSELEANVSLTASQFARMITDVRAVETMLA